MNRCRVSMALLGLLGGCLGSILVSEPGRAADRALLVGLDRYGDPRVNSTPGGATDARSMLKTLEQTFGFTSDQIRLLVDDQATSQAILGSFQEWLIEGSGPGDRVFFLYAGHGSQLVDQNGDESDGYDETLAPYDVDPETGGGQIRDDVLDTLIAQLSGRRAVLLFDSCHSGTLTRSAAGSVELESSGVRYLPRPDQFSRLEARVRSGAAAGPTSGGYRIEHNDSASGDDDARVVDNASELGRMAGVVAISAAGPGQLAYPVEVEGNPRGALSWLFEEAVKGPEAGRGFFGRLKGQLLGKVDPAWTDVAHASVKGGLNGDLVKATAQDLRQEMTISALEGFLGQTMQRLQSTGQLAGNQRPWFEVLSERPITEQPLFGDWQQAAEVAMSNPLDSRRVSLKTADDEVLFLEGEDIGFEVWTDRSGYLYLLVFSEAGQATCVFPNPADLDNQFGPGHLRIPTHGGYRLPAQAPWGRDLAVAVVSDAALPLCEKVNYSWTEIFARVELDAIHQRLHNRVRQRGVGFQSSTSSNATFSEDAAGPSWQTQTLVLRTVEVVVGGDSR